MRRPSLRRVAVLVAALLPCLWTSAPAADEEVVSAVLSWEPSTRGPLFAIDVEWTEVPPEGAVVPADGRGLRYLVRPIGDSASLFFAVETAPAEETGESDAEPEKPLRIWVDHDFDLDLTDGDSAEWVRRRGRLEQNWGLSVPSEAEREGLATDAILMRVGDVGPEEAKLGLRSHRSGTIELGDRVRLVALVDRTHDLRFDHEDDRVLLDIDGDGSLDTSEGSLEELRVGAPFRLPTGGFTPRLVNAIGSAVEFVSTPDAPPASRPSWSSVKLQTGGSEPSEPSETVAELLERIETERDQAYATRRPAIDLLGRTRDERALDVLVSLAEDDADKNVRGAAIRALGHVHWREAAGAQVMEWGEDNDTTIANAAFQALHGMDHPERARVFRAAAGHSNASIVGAALRYLLYSTTTAPETADEVHQLVRDAYADSSQDVHRYQIYNVLRMLPEGPGEDRMLDAARTSYESLRARGLEDLHAVAHPSAAKLALAAVEDATGLVLGRALAKILGSRGDEDAVEGLLTLAAVGHASLRSDLAKALQPLRGDGAVDALIDGLRHEAPAVRALAAEALAGIVRRETTAALLKQVKREKDPGAAAAILTALGDHGNPDATKLLLKAARNRDEGIRGAAIRALARVGLGLPKVREFFLSLLDSDRWEDRILAIDAAALTGDISLAERVRASLSHERWEVRLTVAEALRKLRERESVEPLIVQLEQEEERRVATAIGQTLFELTGVQLYAEAGPRRRWFEDHGETFEVPDVIPVAPKVEGGTSAGFYGIPIESERVIFVIDQSGSMSAADRGTGGEGEAKNRLEAAVLEVKRALGNLPTGSRVNVLFFHTTHQGWRDRLTKLGKRTRADLIDHLDKQRPTGGTNIYDPLAAALQDDDVDTVLLLSDGVPGSGKYVATADILRGVRRLNQTRRIAIHCVSLGMRSELLERLAAENGGRYVQR